MPQELNFDLNLKFSGELSKKDIKEIEDKLLSLIECGILNGKILKQNHHLKTTEVSIKNTDTGDWAGYNFETGEFIF